MVSPRSLMSRVRTGFSTATELVQGLWRGPFWWLVPLLFILLPLGVVFVFLQAYPLVAPFVYTTF